MTSKRYIDITLGWAYATGMARAAFTLRIDPKERDALEILSKIERRPINQLLNDAIKLYLGRESSKERDLEANLEKLRAYRQRDPQFENAIAAFVDAEAKLEDPLEGELIDRRVARDEDKLAGPVQSKVRGILGA
jgi:predicted transcriptional regulator